MLLRVKVERFLTLFWLKNRVIFTAVWVKKQGGRMDGSREKQ